MRTTIKTLQYLVDRINQLTGSPTKPYLRVDGDKLVAQIGNYHLSQAYGGVCLHRMHNDGGGVTTPLIWGHVPKRELEIALRAFISGLEIEKGGK